MAIQYSPLTGMILQADGDDVDSWGDVANNNFTLLEQAAKGVATISVSGSYSLPYTEDATDLSHFGILNIANGAGGTVTLQPTQGQFLVLNNSSGDVVFQVANSNTSVALVHAGVCSVIVNDGAAVHQLGAGGVSVADQLAINLANARAYTDSTAWKLNTGIIPAQPDHAGQFLATDGNAAMWRAPMTADIPDLANVVVMQAGSTMAGPLSFANTAGQVGNAISAGLHFGLANVSLRAFANKGAINLQTYAGANTLATVSAAGASFSVPISAPALTSNGSAVWTAATLDANATVAALGYTPVNKAGDTLSAPIYFSDAGGLGIGSGPSAGLAGDGATVYLRAYSNSGTIALQTQAGASTLATVSSSAANFNVPLQQGGNQVFHTGNLTPSDYQLALGYTPANRAGDIFSGGVSINFAANTTSYDAGGMLTLSNQKLSGDQRTVALGTSPSGNGYVRNATGVGLDLVVGATPVATFGPSAISFASRPLYGSNVAFDTGNLNISNYAQVVGANLVQPQTSTVPSTPQAIVNKAYVDGAIAAAPTLRNPGKAYLTFTGSWTPPAGVTSVWVQLVGAGGGGAGAGSAKSGGGGGAGGYSEGSVPVTPGTAISYVVGQGGAGGLTGADGAAGSTTSFGPLSASGGGGGVYVASTAGGGGGVGSGGGLNLFGAPGTDGDVTGLAWGGDGGMGYFGGGGRAGAGQGIPGYVPGTGGGGAYNGTGPGGAGAGGLIILTY